MSVDEAALTELVTLAHQRGSISMEDLRNAFPVDRMTVEEISAILARLDEAGFDVESDPGLLSPTRHATPQDATTISKPEQAELPQVRSESKSQPAGLPTSTDDLLTKTHAAPRQGISASAPMLPWIAAFVIVVLIAFAAFAF